MPTTKVRRTKHLLYASKDQSVFVVDIPTSICDAQGFINAPSRRLISCAPLQKPYPSRGLKPAKDAGSSIEQTPHELRQQTYAQLIRDALVKLERDGFKNSFCLPRAVANTVTRGVKRPHSDVVNDDNDEAVETEAQLDKVSRALRSLCRNAQSANANDPASDRYLSDETGNKLELALVMYNVTDHPVIVHEAGNHALRFHVPAYAAVLNALVQPSEHVESMALTYALKTSGLFALIVLDPPWPNRSARRKAAYESYDYDNGVRSLDTLCDMLRDVKLGQRMDIGGYMAIWITNKAAVYQACIELMTEWGVNLVEEWVWAKVTEHGEPTSDLDGTWRQPWEVLLVGRSVPNVKVDNSPERLASVKRRVLFAVPDVHSRKPCLKSLFEDLLLRPRAKEPEPFILSSGLNSLPSVKKYAVLELFARYMVNRWMSWGNEPLKYQWEGHWVDE